MTVQTSYPVLMALGTEGQIYDLNGDEGVITKIARAVIPFGRVAVFGGAAGIEGCALPSSAAEVTGGFSGISIKDQLRTPGVGYGIGDPVALCRRGRIWMLAENAITAPGPVFVRFGGTGAPGRARSDADGGNAAELPRARFLTLTSGADQLVVVEVNLP